MCIILDKCRAILIRALGSYGCRSFSKLSEPQLRLSIGHYISNDRK